MRTLEHSHFNRQGVTRTAKRITFIELILGREQKLSDEVQEQVPHPQNPNSKFTKPNTDRIPAHCKKTAYYRKLINLDSK